MRVAIEITPTQTNRILTLWKEEHNDYYGTPSGALARATNPLTGELEYCGYATVEENGKTYHRWLTSGGNIGVLDVEEGILLYLGRRHAVGGMALPLGDLIGFPKDPADSREYRDRNARTLVVLDYETTKPGWAWWETANDYAA